MKKNALNTSLRSAIHATDSTCNGCTAKTADYKRASPQRACHSLQRHKKKDDGERVQEDIGKVMPACV